MQVPQFTLDDYEKVFADRHLLHNVVTKWARIKPNAPAILSAEGNRTVTWSEFDRITTALAGQTHLNSPANVAGSHCPTQL
jgi:hypothetical protein